EVVDICCSMDAPQIGVQPAIEYAVKMRRFADDALLDENLKQGKVDASHIDVLACNVARFHAQCAAIAPSASYGNAETIRAVAMQNFEQMRTLLSDRTDLQQLAMLELKTNEAWQACAALFESRRSTGRVRECHGDLHLGNIALIDDAPVPFDCIEFAPSLRWIDVLDEVAFTMMDLLQHGRKDLAWRYLNAYLEATGDYAGLGVLRFYLAYRAAVRAKISAIRASQSVTGSDACAHSLQACRAHLALAQRCLTDRQPALIITHGLPGSGKTTFAQYVIEQLGAVRLRSDVERKRLFGLVALADSCKQIGDIYNPEATEHTYSHLEAQAKKLMECGECVIVDAAFLKRAERDRFRLLAESMQVPFKIASLGAEADVLRERISLRKRDASEADVAVLQKLMRVQEPLVKEELPSVVRFTTEQLPGSKSNEANWRKLIKMLDRR
ncbi:MAG: AAA family ATPase, partial [Sideroxydans sp.]|nr:AAA family ATPase [Sideroxydans sp.]